MVLGQCGTQFTWSPAVLVLCALLPTKNPTVVNPFGWSFLFITVALSLLHKQTCGQVSIILVMLISSEVFRVVYLFFSYFVLYFILFIYFGRCLYLGI
jgi:hypothetical protein